MIGAKLINSMHFLSDEMIAEAMNAKKITSVRRRRWYIPMAACLCLSLVVSVFWWQKNHIQQPQQIEPGYQLNEVELHASTYDMFCPNYEELDCVLEQAGVYGYNHTFHALFTSTDLEITVIARPIDSVMNYTDRLVDLDTLKNEDVYQFDCPVFLEEQFSAQCQKHIKLTHAVADYKIMQFSVVTQDYMVEYVLKSVSLDRITQAFASISYCYE